MRYAILAAFLVVAGCGDSIHPDAYPEEEPGPEGTYVEVDQSIYDSPSISELGTDATRPIAKTIEWPGISTEEGASYADDIVVVDRITREDADGSYGARVRLKNKTQQLLRLEYVIRFYDRQGGRIAGYKGVAGDGERWTSFTIEPLKYAVVDDFARVIGAEGFRLHVRAPGGAGDGAQDTPERLEQLRLQREAARNQ